MNLKVIIGHDQDVENPADYSGWKVVSFSNRHSNFDHPDNYANVETTDKIKKGEAFVLSYYEHSGCVWSLTGELPPLARCPWDSVGVAGILLWEGEKGEECPGEDSARSFIQVYTMWCNGLCYFYTIEEVQSCDACGQDTNEIFGGCGGYIGHDYMVEEISREVEAHTVVEVAGDASGDLTPSDFEMKAEAVAG